ncbi:MAG TPA: ABC transporter ATP-binding protein [Myxococcota bacterium]|nr:ABC transporter ATP-binding protein [Myxococcota bacterium]
MTEQPHRPTAEAPDSKVPILELRNIVKDYQLGNTTVNALRGVDLVIQRGEFTALMGPSGSGKSTLLNIIGCLDRPTSGEFLLHGNHIGNKDFDDLADVRNQKIGFIFQSFNLIPVFNVTENVEFPCLISRLKLSRAEIAKRARDAADAVGLTPFLKHRPDELSGGQRQRVAIARALVTQPEMVLADEPTANLDSGTSEQIIDLMLELNRTRGVTFLFSTHDHRVVRHARRVVHIADGRIVEGGSELEGLSGPHQLKVAAS